ncbi:NAD(P)H-flavin reductase [Hasllibacter halocynthiae]|uniref:NAD(P)H-flavin reductase n=1 Tax=Hasllibacter halocynthiae TaxID=595589 RepID=A0A2T0WZC4_9RHOB|nr:fatty acid desaturase [Hasllibacter halocynthiae]PRY92053.1 NAD(P)H-flavin reductase [Hasllibacter halocynthiae]
MLHIFSRRGPRTARINGRAVEVAPNETILQAALGDGIDFPFICRVGGCATCKCRLTGGEVDELTETGYVLTEEEIADGYILACQSRPRTDVEIELPAEPVVSAEKVAGRIVGREFLTHDIVRLDVQLDRPLDYRAGQFASLTLDDLPEASRSYSFSTAPDDGGRVGFTIRRVPGGAFSGHVFDEDVVGAGVSARGPAGEFHLREGEGRALFVAGGSGLAPILAILEEMDRTGDRRPVTLMFGARQERDLYALEEIEGYAARRPGFRFVPVLSDDDYNPDWKGRHGFVTDFIAEEAEGVEAAYLCGPPGMVDSAEGALKALGMPGEAIHADRFIIREGRQSNFWGAVGLPVIDRPRAKPGDYLKFGVLHMAGLLAIATVLLGGFYAVIGVAIIMVAYAFGDLIAGEDVSTPDYGQPWILTLQLWTALPLVMLLCFCFMWQLSTGDPLGFGALVHATTGYDIVAARAEANPVVRYVTGIVGVGLMIGGLATITAHELTHRTWDPVSMFVGRWLLAFSFDVGFSIEHVYGHHRYVATDIDPATAPRGRNVYAHIVHSIVHTNLGAARIEADRLRRKGLPVWSLRNAYLRGLLMSLSLLVAAFLIAGWLGVLMFTLTALFARSLLEIVNYMEHYGMIRVPEQPVQPRHSWNTNAVFSSWAMFNLGRHSHHHAQGEVPFQDLMSLPDAPKMRYGYLATMGITLIPPAWNRMMVERLKHWDANYASPEERVLAREANRRSGLRGLMDYDPSALPPAGSSGAVPAE